jgi:DNA-binding XRE family transcriptional regulator
MNNQNINSAAQDVQFTAQQFQVLQELLAYTVRQELERAGVFPKPARTMFSVVEAAEMLGVSKQMIYKMERDGDLQLIELSRGKVKRSIQVPIDEIQRIKEKLESK